MTDHTADQAERIADASLPDASPAAQSQGTSVRHAGVQLFQVLALTALFATSFVGWAWWQTGSTSLIWPYLQGQRLLVQPLSIELGKQPVDSVIDRVIHVVNVSGSDVTLLGAQKSCGCVSLDEFPVTVPTGMTHELHVSVGMPYSPGPFEQSIKFFTDHDDRSSFAVTVTATAR